MVEKPDITYEMVAGLDDEILSVREAIELPLTKPELFTKVGIKPPKGILLVGPPWLWKNLACKSRSTSYKGHIYSNGWLRARTEIYR